MGKSGSNPWSIIGTSFLMRLRQGMVQSFQDYVYDGLVTLLAFQTNLSLSFSFRDDFDGASYCLSVLLLIAARVCFVESVFLDAEAKVFEVWEYTSIVYVHTPPPLSYEGNQINCSFEGLCTFFLSLGSVKSMLECVVIFSRFYERLVWFATSAWIVKEQQTRL